MSVVTREPQQRRWECCVRSAATADHLRRHPFVATGTVLAAAFEFSASFTYPVRPPLIQLHRPPVDPSAWTSRGYRILAQINDNTLTF